jgi:hypothetical protein
MDDHTPVFNELKGTKVYVAVTENKPWMFQSEPTIVRPDLRYDSPFLDRVFISFCQTRTSY